MAEDQHQLCNYFFVAIGEGESGDFVEHRPWNLFARRLANVSPFLANVGGITTNVTDNQLAKLITTPQWCSHKSPNFRGGISTTHLTINAL